MTEPVLERWLADEHADPELCRLLQAGLNERPRTQAMRVAPLVISTLLTVQAAAAAAPVAEGAARHALTTAVLKWFAGGALLSVVAMSASQALAPAPQAVATVVQRALPPQPRVIAPATPVEPPVASAAEPRTGAPNAAPLKLPTVRADVAQEVALLDAARVALLHGDARLALGKLSQLDGLPARALLPEATVLRVRALLALNDQKNARKVAGRFVAAAPGSPQAAVLRGLFAEPLETK